MEGGGAGGRYDTLPGLKPRHSAPVTNEKGMRKKHSGGGGTSCVCAAGLWMSCTFSSFLSLSLSVWIAADTECPLACIICGRAYILNDVYASLTVLTDIL